LVKPLSIEEAYQWAQSFVAREWRLLLPVALAFMALPGLIFALPPLQAEAMKFSAAVQGHDVATAEAILRWLVPLGVLIFIIAAFGGLAITAMALLPAISVREALGIAARRVGVLIGSLLLVLIAELGITMVLAVLLGMVRLNPASMQSLVSIILVGLGVFVGVRLFPLTPMVVRRRIGPVSALRETWLLTQGVFWRVFATAAVYVVGAMVVMLALSAGVGSLLLMLGGALGATELATAINVVFQQAVGALLALGFHLVAAAVFRQLDGSSRGI
jgi:hypothetical protein